MPAKALTVLRITLFDSSKKIQAHAIAPSPSPPDICSARSVRMQRLAFSASSTASLSTATRTFTQRCENIDSTSSQHRQIAVPVTYVLQVRVKCVQTIGKLVMEYSSKFLDNSYLKYIGWALYDKVADVRLVALEALDVFYNSSLIPNLEAFTTRFR